MSEQIRTADSFRLDSGASSPTVVGAGSALAALNNSSDADYVHVGLTGWDSVNRSFILTYTTTLTAAQPIRSLRVGWRGRGSGSSLWMYPEVVIGYIGTDVAIVHLPVTAPGVQPPGAPTGGGVLALTTPSYLKPENTSRAWSECTSFDVVWTYHTSVSWDATNFPYTTYAYMAFDYRDRPVVTVTAPSGTVTVPQPAVSWSVAGEEDGYTQTSYRAIVVPIGATDAASVTAGSVNFDPTTASTIEWDSGRVFSAFRTATTGSSLTNGVHYAYVMVWAGSGASEQSSAWDPNSFTVDVDTVDAPTVAIADDAASYTIQVTIAAGAHTADQIADLIEVQYLDPLLGWVAAPITDSVVNGTGTSIFYDGLQTPGATVSYRARGLYAVPASDGQTVSSAWVTATHVVSDLHQHWLRSPSDYTLNRSLHSTSALLLKEWKPSRARPQAATWGVGARTATVVHDITKSDVHEVTVWAITRAAYDDLRALVEGDDDLMFVSEWGEVWRCQVGDRIEEAIVPAGPRAGELTELGHVRQVSFTLIEVTAP